MKLTAVEFFDEQIQERVIAQDVVARKMIIEISMEDYMGIKKQAKEIEIRQMIDSWNAGYDDSEAKYSRTKISDKPTMIFGEHQIQMLEISDEEIEKKAKNLYDASFLYQDSFMEGAKWYREQLKSKGNG